MKTGTEGGKAELVHYFCYSRNSQLSFGCKEAMVLPEPCGRGLAPQPRRQNNGWDKIYVIISSFTARKPIIATVVIRIVSCRFDECVCCICR